jgi:hypothetical protein
MRGSYPEVTGSNPVPATTNSLVRVPFDVMTKGTWSFLAAIWQQTWEATRYTSASHMTLHARSRLVAQLADQEPRNPKRRPSDQAHDQNSLDQQPQRPHSAPPPAFGPSR